MNLLVTAGNTLTLIDKVRAITNIFTGGTGAAIALEGYARGHRVTLLTSHPERVAERAAAPGSLDAGRWQVATYRTFDELRDQMWGLVTARSLDAVVHCAAVSDYACSGVYAPARGTHFDAASASWQAEQGPARLADRAAGKVKSDEAEIWLRLTRTPKLVDMIRRDWGYRGTLVKFKLEVGVADDALLDIAERSRRQSAADLMVANTLEGAAEHAYIGPPYRRVRREELPATLLESLEQCQRTA